MAATNHNLATLVAEKQFRMDLYYRLNVFPIVLPPLRQRREDIPMLVAHFVHRYAERMSKPIPRITKSAMETLLRHPWPGNMRELQNVVERAVILTMDDVLQPPAPPSDPSIRTEPVTLAEAERDHILTALHESNWVVGGRVRRHGPSGLEADDLDQQNAQVRSLAGNGRQLTAWRQAMTTCRQCPQGTIPAITSRIALTQEGRFYCRQDFVKIWSS